MFIVDYNYQAIPEQTSIEARLEDSRSLVVNKTVVLWGSHIKHYYLDIYMNGKSFIYFSLEPHRRNGRIYSSSDYF
jgi:hypothetical protein